MPESSPKKKAVSRRGVDLDADVTLTADITRGPTGEFGEPGTTERVECSASKFHELPEEEQSFWMAIPGFKEWLTEARRIIAEKEGDKQG